MKDIELIIKIKDILEYKKYEGKFIWKKQIGKRAKIGNVAGSKDGCGYRQIMIEKKSYKEHHLVRLIEKGELPKLHIDHINHNKQDNRISNLREVSRVINQKNRKLNINNKSGYIGVRWHERRKKWQASIGHKGKKIELGFYKNINNAIFAREEANKKYGYHKNHGNN